MTKLTLKQIMQTPACANSDIVDKLQRVNANLKLYRNAIVDNKKELTQSIKTFDLALDLYAKSVKGESVNEPLTYQFNKNELENAALHIGKVRKLLNDQYKHLHELRKENYELFSQLFEKFVESSSDTEPQKIKLDRQQAKSVFNKLYSLFESGEDFEEVTIKIG